MKLKNKIEMSKNKSVRNLAFRKIQLETILYISTASAIILFIFLKITNWKMWEIWEIVGTLLLFLTIKTVCYKKIFTYRLKKNFKEKIIEIQEAERKSLAFKQKNLLAKKLAQQHSYPLSAVMVSSENTGEFILRTEDIIRLDARPVIKINGQTVNTYLHYTHIFFCRISNLNSKTSKLVFENTVSRLVINNPFYYKYDGSVILWQNEGHTNEKKILLPAVWFPYATKDALYTFDLIIHKSRKGTYEGKLDLLTGKIVIPITNVNKEDCLNKKCVLRFSWDKGMNITLPAPQIMTVNRIPVAGFAIATD